MAAKACALAPKEPKYHIFLGDLFQKSGNFKGAKIEWEKALEYDSQNQELKNKIAQS